MSTTLFALSLIAAGAGIYKILTSSSGSIRVFELQFSWGK